MNHRLVFRITITLLCFLNRCSSLCRRLRESELLVIKTFKSIPSLMLFIVNIELNAINFFAHFSYLLKSKI